MVERYRHPLFALQYDLSEGDASHLGDREWYADRLRDTEGPILELAAGTGRITLALAAAGHRVVALDIGHPMLAILMGKIPGVELRERILPICADMARLPLAGERGPRFAAAVCGYNSLGCFTDRDALGRCFAEVRRVLAPGGRFCFDVAAHRDVDYGQGPRRFDWQEWRTPDGRRIRRRTTVTAHRDRQLLDIRYTYRWRDEIDSPREETVSFALNLWPPETYHEAAGAAGFTITAGEEKTFEGPRGRERMWLYTELTRS